MTTFITATRWVGRGLTVAALLLAGWTSYKFFTEPGYLAGLVLGPTERIAMGPADPVRGEPNRPGRLPQAGAVAPGQAGPGAGMAAPAETGEAPADAGAYRPPPARRKVIRVGD